MLQIRGRLDLAQKAVGADDRRELVAQHLDRDVAIVLEIAREIHRRHPAGAELALDAIAIGEARAQAIDVIGHLSGRDKSSPLRCGHERTGVHDGSCGTNMAVGQRGASCSISALRPRPSCEAPPLRAFWQRDHERGTGFLLRLAFRRRGIGDGKHDVRRIASDVDDDEAGRRVRCPR